jgi:ankyrin repeat protein
MIACVPVCGQEGCSDQGRISAQQKALEKALKKTDLPTLKRLLDSGLDASCRDEALSSALRTDNLEMFRMLLDAHTDVNHKDNAGVTALMGESRMGDPSGVQMLLDAHADANAKDFWGETALMYASKMCGVDYQPAVYKRYLQVVRLLVQGGADVTARNKKGQSALDLASSCNHEAEVQIMLPSLLEANARRDKAEAEARAKRAQADAAGTQAAQARLAAFLQTSVPCESRAPWTPPPDNPTPEQRRVLSLVGESDLTAAEALIGTYPQVVNIRDSDGFTPLAEVANFRNVTINVGYGLQGTMEDRSATQEVPILAKLLIAEGADVNAIDNTGGTPLLWAVMRRKTGLAEFLIQNCANVNFSLNTPGEEGMSPLHFAAANGEMNVFKDLLAAGARIDGKNNKGETPLDLASHYGWTEIVEFLRKKGAN